MRIEYAAGWMPADAVNCTVCHSADCEPAAHAAWTEFDAELGIWIERTSLAHTMEQFESDTTDTWEPPQTPPSGGEWLAQGPVCPECGGDNLSEESSKICWDCQASDYLEEEETA